MVSREFLTPPRGTSKFEKWEPALGESPLTPDVAFSIRSNGPTGFSVRDSPFAHSYPARKEKSGPFLNFLTHRACNRTHLTLDADESRSQVYVLGESAARFRSVRYLNVISSPVPVPLPRLSPGESGLHPRVGMLATVRNRRGLVSAVEPFDGAGEGRLNLVKVEYLDADGGPDDQVVWELETGKSLLEPTALPDPGSTNPMPPGDADALIRATRWTALTPFLDPDGDGGPLTRLPVASPFHGAIQVDDFQLVPLLKALRMPRISLLLADDVGLGKTVEAGLILSELLIRRRVRRVLILSPATLRTQWQQEMDDKFSLPFDIVDRDQTHGLRKRLGLDANPWRTFPRIITSFHYLKQPDVLESFVASCRVPDGSAHLPWDLLIVDEVHNLMPAPFGEESELTRMLRILTPYFEHRLFLSATPHNGHTRSFTGLLEMLDPVRFTQTTEISQAERSRVEDVVVRRLKSEINARTTPPRFSERHLVGLPLDLSPAERALSEAFQGFRKKVRSLVATAQRREQVAGAFAVEILGKRLLSCPYTFADSWHRYLDGLREAEQADADEVRAAERATDEDTASDLEAESRIAHAVHIVGAWLKPWAERLRPEMADIDQALGRLGLADWSSGIVPAQDARFDALAALAASRLRDKTGAWRADERLVVFTEYKTTLDYLKRRLQALSPGEGGLRVLTGGMDEQERGEIKRAFNDPASPLRILLGTDAAAEGLNLQETARYLLHYDVPWNPSRLEQRNGRLDRHGQARDVFVFHFTTDDDADLQFLAHVVGKVNSIREDLGSAGEVFDAAFQRRFVAGEERDTVQRDLDLTLAVVRGRAVVPRDASVSAADEPGQSGDAGMKALAAELDLDADSLKDTLEAALGMGYGRPRFEAADTSGRVRLKHPIPAGWADLVDESLRLDGGKGQKGALPSLVFDPAYFIHYSEGRPVFRPAKDVALLHLAHPLYQRALASFARLRFPGTGSDAAASRWTVRRGPVPAGADGLLLLTVEELAVNELRESFHHWVRTIQIPIRDGELGEPLPHQPALELRLPNSAPSPADVAEARILWEDVRRDVRDLLDAGAADLTARLGTRLGVDRADEAAREQERFQSRQGELSHLIQQQTLARLEREIEGLKAERKQGSLFDNEVRLADLEKDMNAKMEELARRTARYEELREQLTRERKRILENLIPKRYALRGQAQVFPVAVEVRLPEGGR